MDTVTLINNFRNLPPGWHFGEGITPSDQTISIALSIHDAIPNGIETDAFPGIDGEIQVSAYITTHAYEFTVNPNNTIDYYHESNRVEIESIDGLSQDDAIKIASRLSNSP